MNKEGKNWLLTTMVTLLLLLAMIPSFNAAYPNNVVETGDAAMEGIETKEGICGQKIWINTSGWNVSGSDREYVEIFFSNNDTSGTLDYGSYIKRAKCDSSGEHNVSINIPYRDHIEEYNVSMLGKTSGDYVNFTFNISGIYKVETDPEVIYWDDTESQFFTISVYNWTGSTYELLKETVRYRFWEPDFGEEVVNNTMNLGTINTDALFNWSESTPDQNREANYALNITEAEAPFDLFASIWVPVRFHMIDVEPKTVTFGDTETIQGKVIDGGDDPVVGLNYVNVVSPNGGTYSSPVTTTSTGSFAFAIYFNESGTWFIGTQVDADHRPTDEETTKGVTDFIWYDTIECSPAAGEITVDPDETTYGFNISLDIYAEDKNGDPIDDAWVYVTGVDCEFPAGDEWDKDEYVPLGQTNSDGWLNKSIADEFKFKEAGTATFLFTWPEDWDTYENNDDLEPNIDAETKVTVGSPGSMNVFIAYGGNDRVLLGDPGDSSYSDPPASGTSDPEEWGNWSSYLNITIYGKTDSTLKNATITVVGCGLDLEYDEEDFEVPGT